MTRPPFPRALLLTAALLCTLGLQAGCSGQNEAKLMASARSLLADKKPAAARLQLKTVLQDNPDSGEARFLLGRLMRDAGEMAPAEAELRRALEARHPESLVLPVLADAMLAQGKSKLLLLQFGQTTLPAPAANAELKTHLAAAALSEGDSAAARAQLDQALRNQPGFEPALLLRARLAAIDGDPAAALAQVEQLLQRQPDSASAWALKGELLAQTGERSDPAGATAAWRKSLAIRPDNVAVHAALISSLLMQRDQTGAQAQWAQLKKLAPDHPQTLFFEAVLAGLRDDLRRARELAQLLLRHSPENLRVLMLAGQTELRLGAAAQAETYFAKAVAVAPKAAVPRRSLAQAQLRNGQADKALATLRPLLEASSADAQALTLAAQAQLVKGDAKAADALFARAARANPADTRVRTALALSQLSRGHDAAGFGELQTIAGADSGTVADLALINARLQRTDLPGALKAVDALAAKTPDDALPDQLRGRIALQRKDTPAARRHFEKALAKNADYMPALAGLAAMDIADHQPGAAAARFESLLQRHPGHAGAMIALAEINGRNGDMAESGQWLEMAIKAEPTDATPRKLLIDLQLASRQAKAAQATAQTAVDALPDNADLVDRLGRAQLQNRDDRGALVSFAKLAALLPQSPLPQLRLADAQMVAGNRDAVAGSVRRALAIAPNDPLVRQAEVQLAMMENKLPQALALARQMQARSPGQAMGFIIEGDVALRQKQWDAAATAYRQALTRTAPGDAVQRLHQALLLGGKAAEAERMAADRRRAHPEDLGFVLYLGDAATAANRPEQAEPLYREVLARAPKHAIAMNNLAYTLAVQKKPGAVAMAEQALKLAPDNPMMLDTLALSLAADQQLARAIEQQTKAVSLAPQAPEFRLQLAKLQLKSGDKASARAELITLSRLGARFARQPEVSELLKANGG